MDHLQTQFLTPDSGESAEKKSLVEALRQTNGNQTQAARFLSINRVNVWNRMKKYGIDSEKVLTTYWPFGIVKIECFSQFLNGTHP
jgi:transcriptional regulator with GAF, ATPase, and Fis domain